MHIFAQEIKDGLTEQLVKSNSIAFEIVPSVIMDSVGSTFNGVPSVEDISQNVDLLYFNSVLASVGWNKNDDVFDTKELWRAKSTPVNKKINYMHDEKDIIGHMTNSNVIDFSGRFVPDNLNEESLPNNFDVVVGGYLYKYWQSDVLRDRMQDILSKVGNQELAVSMECIFPFFDYAIETPDGEHRVITRTDDTSFLTKYLRRYGGDGNFEGFKVGRLLRSMVFTGNALVDKPANPRSLILRTGASSFLGTDATISIFKKNNLKSEKNMEFTKELHDSLVKRLETAEAAAKEASKKEIDSLKEKYDATLVNLAKSQEDNKKLSGELAITKELAKSHEDKSVQLNEQIKILETSLAKAKEDLDKYNKEMCKSKRKSAMAQLDVDDARANELLDKFAGVSDEIFDEFVKSMPKKVVTTITTATTASLTDALKNATNIDTNVTVPDTQKNLFSQASEWFSSTLSKKVKGE